MVNTYMFNNTNFKRPGTFYTLTFNNYSDCSYWFRWCLTHAKFPIEFHRPLYFVIWKLNMNFVHVHA